MAYKLEDHRRRIFNSRSEGLWGVFVRATQASASSPFDQKTESVLRRTLQTMSSFAYNGTVENASRFYAAINELISDDFRRTEQE